MECRITVSSHCQDLTNCMYQLQQKGLLCDAGLECKDGVVYIHKLVLLSCDIPYFYHQVPTGISLSKCYIGLRNFTLRSVCGLVQILYTGRLRLFRDYLNEFIELCSFLGLVRIKAAVQSFLDSEKSDLDSGQNTSETNQGELPCVIQSTESYFYPDKVPRVKTETDDVVDSTSEIGQVRDENKDEFDATDSGDSLDRVESVTGTDSTFMDKDENNDNTVIQNVKPTIMEKQAIHQAETLVVPVNMINVKTRQKIAVNCHDANNVSELFHIAKQLSTGSTDNKVETTHELPSVPCTEPMDVVEDIKPDRVDCHCSVCNQMFIQDIQKINAQEKLVCEQCRGQEDKRTETLEEVQLDQIEQSTNQTNDSEDQMNPGFCGKVFQSLTVLRQHEKTHTKTSPYMCCGKGFSSKSNFERHRCHNHNAPKSFACPKCGKGFAVQADLNRHTKREAGDLKFSCKICNMKFESAGVLKDHEGKHDNEKRHCCKICYKTFRHQSNLSRHEKIHKHE